MLDVVEMQPPEGVDERDLTPKSSDFALEVSVESMVISLMQESYDFDLKVNVEVVKIGLSFDFDLKVNVEVVKIGLNFDFESKVNVEVV